jgi:hypothetical protein
MKQKGTRRIGTFGVREMGIYGEKILHAPKDTKGRFDLSICEDGTLVYQPVKP